MLGEARPGVVRSGDGVGRWMSRDFGSSKLDSGQKHRLMRDDRVNESERSARRDFKIQTLSYRRHDDGDTLSHGWKGDGGARRC